MRPLLTLHNPALARSYYEAGLWTNDTFYSLLAENAERTPDAKALRDGRLQLDWRTLKSRVDAMADDLVDTGIVAGDRVSIWMSNRIEGVVAFLACSREQIICNPSLHKSYTCGEIVDLMTQLQTVALVTENGWGADRRGVDFNGMIRGLPFLRKVYSPDDFPRQIIQSKRPPQDDADSIAYLAFTSGTTGKPKCVMHSSNTLLANARDLVRDWRLNHDAVILLLSPLSHHITWVALSQSLLTGSQLVMDDPPAGMSRLDWIIETDATYVMGVPTHAMDILTEQKRREMPRIGNVRTFYMAGAPIPEVVAQAFVDQGIVPQNVYGMTECSSHQYTHPDDSKEVWISTCGRGGPSYEVRIFDPQDRDQELPSGQSGEIGGRGACLMLGYFANQEATEKSFNRHGYLMSGDLGSLDEAGNLRIEGRIKDLIIRGGHNIYPARIEALALTHPAVEKVAAFGIPDERLGEKVCLAVIGQIGAADMLDHLASRNLSKYDMPEWFVSVVDLPMTPSGKILKRELVAMVKRGALSPEPIRYAAESLRHPGP